MSTKTKTLAKSLHTVTALARVAELFRATDLERRVSIASDAYYIGCALRTLGYEGAADPYGLAEKAIAAMQPAEARRAAA